MVFTIVFNILMKIMVDLRMNILSEMDFLYNKKSPGKGKKIKFR